MRIESRQIVVNDTESGLRLDLFLTRRFTKFSRNEWQTRIDEKTIRINGIVAKPARKLNVGDTIEFSYTMREEPEVNTRIETIYEDKDYFVVDKPAGLPVHPSGIYKTQTITTLLVERRLLTTPYLLHRLDRETSGVLALAKNRTAAVAFHRILRAGALKKEYVVAVEGSVDTPIDAEGFIFRLPTSRLPRQRYFSTNPPAVAMEIQRCHTLFTPLLTNNNLTLLKAQLFTGRMHQIRATLSSLGYPVVGDKLYGINHDFYFKFADDTMTHDDWDSLRIARSALHCEKLTLAHPVSGKPWPLLAEIPADIQSIFSNTPKESK